MDPLPPAVVDAFPPGLVELDAIRRIRREQGRGRSAEESRHVLCVGRVAAQDPVVAEAIEVDGLDARLTPQREQARVVDGDLTMRLAEPPLPFDWLQSA